MQPLLYKKTGWYDANNKAYEADVAKSVVHQCVIDVCKKYDPTASEANFLTYFISVAKGMLHKTARERVAPSFDLPKGIIELAKHLYPKQHLLVDPIARHEFFISYITKCKERNAKNIPSYGQLEVAYSVATNKYSTDSTDSPMGEDGQVTLGDTVCDVQQIQDDDTVMWAKGLYNKLYELYVVEGITNPNTIRRMLKDTEYDNVSTDKIRQVINATKMSESLTHNH